MLLSDLIEEYMTECELKGYTESTLYSMKYTFKRFCDVIGDVEIEDIDTKVVKGYLLMRKEEVKANTINNNIKVIRTMFAFAIEEGLIKQNPFHRVRLMNEDKRLSITFTRDEVDAVLDSIKGKDFMSVRNKTIIVTFIETGIRKDELKRIKLDDLRDDFIKVYGKGNKVRYVPISLPLKRQIQRYMRSRDMYMGGSSCEYLFPSRTREKLGRDSLSVEIKRLISLENERTIHDLRRYFAQQMLNKIGIYHLSRLLGHSDIATTQRYINGITDDDIIQKSKGVTPLS